MTIQSILSRILNRTKAALILPFTITYRELANQDDNSPEVEFKLALVIIYAALLLGFHVHSHIDPEERNMKHPINKRACHLWCQNSPLFVVHHEFSYVCRLIEPVSW